MTKSAGNDSKRAQVSDNTLMAYRADWAHFTRWCRMTGADALPPSPELIGLYLTDLAKPADNRPGLSARSIERRLAGLVWNLRQRGLDLDRSETPIVSTLLKIQETHAKPQQPKTPLRPEDVRAMVATLPYDLRGLRDRAILLVAYTGGLRPSELVSLNVSPNGTADGNGWAEIFDEGMLVILRAKNAQFEIEIGRGSNHKSCPVYALEQWLHFSKATNGPIFTRTSRDGSQALEARLSEKHVTRLIKSTVLAARLNPDLREADRSAPYSGHALRIGFASTLGADERFLRKQIDPKLTGPQRSDRFRLNLTKAAGF